MAISDSDLPTFLKRNATQEEAAARDFEWWILGILAGKNNGVLGLRLIEVPADDDVVHMLVAPDCRRQMLAEALQLPEIATSARNKAKEEPGHFISVLAARLEQTGWWHDEVAPRIRAEYFKRRRERFEGPDTRAVTAAELEAIATITGRSRDSGVAGSNVRTAIRRPLSVREVREAVLDWLKERDFDEITPAMVGIGRVGGDAQKLVEISLPTNDPTSQIVLRLKQELERIGIKAEPMYRSNSVAFRFAPSFINSFGA
jgi:hypothetical protein